MSELSSVTCGGVGGVSNTFATALWAPDALFELVRAGVDAVNVHVRPFTVNAAFVPTATGIVPRPLLYGLILFTRTLGPHPQLVDARVRVRPPAHVKVWVVRVGGDALHVLVDNKGDRLLKIELQLPATGVATVQRLLAPSAGARDGVTLDGQRLGPDFDWRGGRAIERITPGPTGCGRRIPRQEPALGRGRPLPRREGRMSSGRAAVRPRGTAGHLRWPNVSHSRASPPAGGRSCAVPCREATQAG